MLQITTLVHDLILTELWREEIYPELMKQSPKSTFGIYTILYHEAACINLIETILYHPNAAETLGDASLDLIDYCFRSLNLMLTRYSPISYFYFEFLISYLFTFSWKF